MTTDKTAEHLQIVRGCIAKTLARLCYQRKLRLSEQGDGELIAEIEQALTSLDALEAYFNNQPKGN